MKGVLHDALPDGGTHEPGAGPRIGLSEPLVLTLVVQVPDKADGDKLGEMVSVITSGGPTSGPGIAHVFN